MDDEAMEERARALEAAERRGLFAELGIPQATPYRYVEAWRQPTAAEGPGDVRARYGVVLADGRRTVDRERVLRELPGPSWPARVRLTGYGVEPTDAVLLGMGLVRQRAQLPLGPAGGAILLSDPEGWESWGTSRGLLWLRFTARDGDSALSGERRRRVDRTWDDRVRGLQCPHKPKERMRAEAALEHARTFEERAVPRGPGVESLEDFLAAVGRAFGQLRRRGARLTEANVAKLYGLGKSAFHTRLIVHYGLTWPELRARFAGGPDGETPHETARPGGAH